MRTIAGKLIQIVLSAAAVAVIAACGGSDKDPTGLNTTLAGNYQLQAFTEAGQNVMPGVSSGTATLTATTYKVNITFIPQAGQAAIVDSGSYTATGSGSGSFTESSLVTGTQAVGTYTDANGQWTVDLTAEGIPIHQVWVKQ